MAEVSESQSLEFAPHPDLVKRQKWEATLQAHKAGGAEAFKKSYVEQYGPDAKADESVHKFSSTQVAMPLAVSTKMQALANRIPDSALTNEGRETDHHVTVLYGLHGTDPEEVRAALAGEPPIKVKLGETSLFKNDDGEVLKLDIDSPDLHRLNSKLAKLPHTNDYPKYEPHATIAYLKPGYGKDYAGDRSLSGKSVTIDTLTFAGKDGKRSDIKLGGTQKPPVG